MKKFIIFSLIALIITALHANGACLMKDLKKKSTCSGAAAPINTQEDNSMNYFQSDKEQLQNMYQVPTMALPKNYNNNFPVLNQNCTLYGGCFPDLK